MKRFFLFFAICGALLLVGICVLLFYGVPAPQKEVVKIIKHNNA